MVFSSIILILSIQSIFMNRVGTTKSIWFSKILVTFNYFLQIQQCKKPFDCSTCG